MSKHIPNTTMLSPSDVAFILDPNLPVLTHTRSMLAESAMEPHAHPRGQLLWGAKGILRVTTEKAVWVVPSTYAVWIPGGHYHQVSNETDTQTRNLYIDPSFCVRNRTDEVTMLKMSSLMREVIVKLTENTDSLAERTAYHLGLVALDELESLEKYELYIPSGEDPRLKRLIRIMVNNPDQMLLLEELAIQVGASTRTIERLFKSETGLTFRQWRSRFRLMNSLEKIAQGQNTTWVAHSLGYSSVSSFISSFKALFGCTPQEYTRK